MMKMNAKAKSKKEKLFVCLENKCIIKFAMRGSEKWHALLMLKFFLYENESEGVRST